MIRVVAPGAVAERLEAPDRSWLEVVAWNGDGGPPGKASEADVWVPAYGVAQSPDLVTSALAAMPRLRVVQLLSAGVEPWSHLVPEHVTLCSGRGIHGGSTAELAVALTLASQRDLPVYVDQQRRRVWRPHETTSVAGRRVLVLGAGDIGRRVGEVLSALGAEVELLARTERAGVRALADLPELLPAAEVLVISVPLTDSTRGLVDASVLAALPDGALVVNVARGAVVDMAALTDEVASGRLRAALDVTDPEPLPEDHPLWGLSGALLTPHVGGGAVGWESRAEKLVAEQLIRLRDGGELVNVVSDGY